MTVANCNVKSFFFISLAANSVCFSYITVYHITASKLWSLERGVSMRVRNLGRAQ